MHYFLLGLMAFLLGAAAMVTAALFLGWVLAREADEELDEEELDDPWGM